MTIEVPLTRGKITVVDEADFPSVVGFPWTALLTDNKWYAIAFLPREPGRPRQHLLMHRVIMRATGDNMLIDHRDGDGLNNQRANLRCANWSQNSANRRRVSVTGFKGVFRKKLRYAAQIKHDGKTMHLGMSPDAIGAAVIYDNAARRLFGEFACLNFPNPGERGALPTDN